MDHVQRSFAQEIAALGGVIHLRLSVSQMGSDTPIIYELLLQRRHPLSEEHPIRHLARQYQKRIQ